MATDLGPTGDVAQSGRGGLSRRRIVVTLLIAAVVLAAAYTAVLRNFLAETDERAAGVVFEPEAKPELDVSVTILTVDPNKGELTARVEFDPTVELAPQGELVKDVIVYTNAVVGPLARTYAKGTEMNGIDVSIRLEGQIARYPFDRHEATLYLQVVEPDPQDPATPFEVPIEVSVTGAPQGFDFSVENDDEDQTDDTVYLAMPFRRAQSTVFFSIFVMTMQWLLALAAVGIVITTTLFGDEIQTSFFGFMSVLMFVFPAIRNAVPGSPPIGSLNDYVSFFWCEIIVALCLVTLVGVWLRREHAAVRSH